MNIFQDLKATAKTLNQVVTFLTEEKRNDNQNIKQILFVNHPVFNEVKNHANLSFRVFFYNVKELDELLHSQGSIDVESIEEWDEPHMREWRKDDLLLKVALEIFDQNGKLKLFSPEEWSEGFVNSRIIAHPNYFVSSPRYTSSQIVTNLDDDLPF